MEKLQKMGLPVRAGSRKANPSFDWDKPKNWPAVFENIEKAYITVQPDFSIPGMLEKLGLLVDTAKESGVKNLVLLSGRGEEDAQKGEKIVTDSGLPSTIVRGSWFMQNFSEYFFLDSILEGEVVVPRSTAPEPFVDVDDIAEVVVKTLTEPGHEGKTYELTGPAALTIEAATAMISGYIGKPIRYREVETAEFIQMFRDAYFPEDVLNLMEYLFTEILDGRNESPTDDIKKVLGREAGSFADYIIKAGQTGIWNPAKSLA